MLLCVYVVVCSFVRWCFLICNCFISGFFQLGFGASALCLIRGVARSRRTALKLVGAGIGGR